MPPQSPVTERILVIAPHADDEVIGCGGTIALAAERGADVTLIIMATGGIKHYHLDESASSQQRLAEMEAAAKSLGVARTRVLFPGHDMRLEGISMLDIVTALDGVLRGGDYDECYLPEPGHNRDHQITHDASIACLRPCGRKPLRMVAAYESTTFDLRSATSPSGTLYVDVASTFEKKLAALRAYQSQIREYPHPVSEEAMRRLAMMRGLECGLHLAERFRILQMVRA